MIFCLIRTELFDLSIMHAKPTNLDLLFFIIFEHSKTDLPVVITSSTIRTFEFSGILKPRLNISLPSNLSAKIVSIFNCRPTSYPTTIPPIAGESIISIFLNFFFIF